MLCVCRPCSACYFLEVIRPTLSHHGKALMISGSHEICTACPSGLTRFTERCFAFPSVPSILSSYRSPCLTPFLPHFQSFISESPSSFTNVLPPPQPSGESKITLSFTSCNPRSLPLRLFFFKSIHSPFSFTSISACFSVAPTGFVSFCNELKLQQ